MSDLPSVVVTGYGSWEKTAANPAAQVVAGLRTRRWEACKVVALEVPVVTAELYDWVEATLLRERPDVWLGLGVAPGSPAIKMEVIGTNWRHFDVPDNSGAQPEGIPVVAQGPAAYNADFPNKEVVAALKAAGIPAVLSYSACTHMCNQMLYTSSHLIARHGLAARCGFLHVPLTPEHVARQSPPEELRASMGLEMMIEAAAIAVRHAIVEARSAA